LGVSNQHNSSKPSQSNAGSGERVWLVALASRREFDAALSAFGCSGALPKRWELVDTQWGMDLVWTGVGKSNAAGAVGRVLNPSRHLGVLSAGIGGALPGSRCAIGDVICASVSIFADEGVCTPDGFVSCAKMGFGSFDDGSDSIAHEQGVVDWLGRYCDRIGPIACVSMCSGTDERAALIEAHTGALGEAMEGAAVSLCAHRLGAGLKSGELRVISNTTGDRGAQQWDLDSALEKLAQVLGRIGADLR